MPRSSCCRPVVLSRPHPPRHPFPANDLIAETAGWSGRSPDGLMGALPYDRPTMATGLPVADNRWQSLVAEAGRPCGNQVSPHSLRVVPVIAIRNSHFLESGPTRELRPTPSCPLPTSPTRHPFPANDLIAEADAGGSDQSPDGYDGCTAVPTDSQAARRRALSADARRTARRRLEPCDLAEKHVSGVCIIDAGVKKSIGYRRDRS